MRSIGTRLCAAVLLALTLVSAAACAPAMRADTTATRIAAGNAEAPAAFSDETLYQWSTLSALVVGLYQPTVTVGEIRQAGNTGIGTFTALDGEMIVLDGAVYQVRADGTVYRSPDDSTSPFAAVTYFDADRTIEITAAPTYDALRKNLDAQMPTVNDIRVIRIPAHFDYVKTRSVPAQTEPYPPLADVTAKQSVFEFRDVDGVLVGIWCPAWIGQINAPGYHFHFLTADKTGGGHVLEVATGNASAQVDVTPKFNLTIPQTAEFQKIDLAGDYQKQMDAAEK
jgi:acetolactate decarboxylase